MEMRRSSEQVHVVVSRDGRVAAMRANAGSKWRRNSVVLVNRNFVNRRLASRDFVP